MTPNPILKVLSTLGLHHVRYLLMGGQACVFYGAAEFSRDTDVAIATQPDRACTTASRSTGDRDPAHRPMLTLATAGDETGLMGELELEEKREREVDRAYWAPLRAELEELRRKRTGK